MHTQFFAFVGDYVNLQYTYIQQNYFAQTDVTLQ